MAIEVRIPELGESISEVQVAEWRHQVGDLVVVDEPLAEIDSDKATVELPAPAAGRLTEIRVQAGQYCKVGDVVAVIDEHAAKDASPPANASPAAAKDAPPTTGDQAPVAKSAGAPIMPAAQRLLTQSGLPAERVPGSGPGGRVLKEDVERAMAAAAPDGAAGAVVGVPAKAADSAPAARPLAGSREERTRPMSPIRRRIAERLVAAQRTAALLTTFNEIDMSAIKAMRERHQDAFQARYGVKLGFMSFFTKAVIEALRLVPHLNSEIRGQDIVERDFYDIGIAIGSGKGLVVPVLRNAETLGFGEIERRIADFAARAQAKKLDLAELEGGTFTISNGGVYGSLLSTPIVNPPQSGVLGLHVIEDRPVVRDSAIVVRPMMYVALTYDHRVVDGREGVAFLKHIKESIEAPERMMLEI
ncbi:MAG: 2-oxoglutarate dehydrogenase complex dihydrolipoyllysine-residue succinyltransferase [Candidatus Krumholzibacteria bacterium]|jgi:2-oxoglutarate dehydrogenase E2 component (dihydrolipoamide succinyltransferase)|nr:2-oxoglutarate dehydrogenase complex dihydrolipoyllysine-residue succinyltransferase [Candidatus Krumholzibacteria bacterium]